MGKKVTFVAEYQGQTFTRTASTGRTYTHVTLAWAAHRNEVIAARWSMSAKAAATKLPDGWEAHRVAVVECFPEGQAPVAEQVAPVAEPVAVELCASNSNAKVMHYRAVGTQVTLCLKATTSRKANARQLADGNVCTGCTAAHQG
jgi:hypothetical protein